MDVAGLSKLSRQAILNVVMVLGFLAHGYATGESGRFAELCYTDRCTGEYEVTEERLGVYLPVEHIDSPWNWVFYLLFSLKTANIVPFLDNDNKDARQVHPKLRPPVDPQELEVDPRTGMMVRG
jgi:hypothetical protein